MHMHLKVRNMRANMLRPCIPNFLPNFRVGFRDGTNIRETERVRKKLEKLVPTLIFGISVLPKLAKMKISAKSHFRSSKLPKFSKNSVKSSEKAQKLVPTLIFESKMAFFGPIWTQNYRTFYRTFFAKITDFR